MLNIPKMDYAVVTKNDEYLPDVIYHILLQENINRVIIVVPPDDINQSSLEMFSKYPNVVIYYTDAKLGAARAIAIGMVETEYFVFVDGDVILPKDWINQMWMHLIVTGIDNVGAAAGRIVRNDLQLKYLMQNSVKTKPENFRLFTHNTIMRTSAVASWQVNNDVSSFEDYLLTQYIIKKGYDCLVLPVFADHYHKGSVLKAAKWGGAGAHYTGAYKNFRAALKDCLKIVGGGIKATLKMDNDWFFSFSMKIAIGTLYGYLRWKKFLKTPK